MTVWDTHRDLAACFVWKQIGLEFSSLASRLVEAHQRVVHVAPSMSLHRVQTEGGRIDAMGCIGPLYPRIVVFYVLGSRGIVVF
jgi:hypothetical protein